MDEISRADLDDGIFLGNVLGSFFLEEPKGDLIEPMLEAFTGLDVTEASIAWPCVPREQAAACLRLMRLDWSSHKERSSLLDEYRRLFVGPGKMPAPPWGSVYTDREGVVFGGTTLEFRRWMRENGIERLSSEATPEDHIGLTLKLLAWLSYEKPQLVKEYLGLHLLPWAPHFLEKVAQGARHDFYKGLALLTKASLEGLGRSLSVEIMPRKLYR